MRDHGLVESAAAFGLNGHACWTYEDDDELIRGASEFLVAGERLGQRLIYVGPSLPDAEAARAMRSTSSALDDVYGAPILRRCSRYYSAATDAALADGYTGLRVVGEVSTVVRDPRVWARHARLGDAWPTATWPSGRSPACAATTCASSRPSCIRDLCAVHPAVRTCGGHPVPFRVYHAATMPWSSTVTSTSSPADRARRALTATRDEGDVLDLQRLRFVDHNGAVALLDSAASLRGIPNMMRRVLDLRGLDG